MKKIVGVRFEDKKMPGAFSGREYSYYVAEGVYLEVFDIIEVPTERGVRKARVNRFLTESQVDESILPNLKEITGKTVERADCSGENVKPARSGAGMPRQISLSDYDLTGEYGYTMEGDV